MKKENIFAISIGILIIFTLIFEFANVMVNSTAGIVVINTDEGEVRITAEIADESGEIAKGLMHRTHLCETCGMLFVFDTTHEVSFWMKNTLIQLDMIFVSENMEIVKIHENVQPCRTEFCENYSSEHPVKYVIEVNAGFVEENGVEVGDSVSF